MAVTPNIKIDTSMIKEFSSPVSNNENANTYLHVNSNKEIDYLTIQEVIEDINNAGGISGGGGDNGNSLKDWDSSNTYAKGDTVIYNNSIYKCKVESSKKDVFDINDWTLLAGYSKQSYFYYNPEEQITQIVLPEEVADKGAFNVNVNNLLLQSNNYGLESDNKTITFFEPIAPDTNIEVIVYGNMIISTDVSNVGVQLPEMSSNTNGQVLSNDGTNPVWVDEQVGYKQITNCITEIPQDIKMELNSDYSITLKAGSKLYKPDGTSFNTSNDISFDFKEYGTSGEGMIYLTVSGGMNFSLIENITSGTISPSLPANGRLLWFDIDTNIIKMYAPNSSEYEECYLPLGICDVVANTSCTIKQVFNGFGFIGSTVFSLPGVKGLIPNGRNEDGSLNNNLFVVPEICLTNYSTSTRDVYFSYGKPGTLQETTILTIFEQQPNTTSTLWYQPSKNIIKRISADGTSISIPGLLFGKFKFENNKVVSLTPKLPIRVPDIQEVVTKDEYLTENEIQRQIFNRIYDGRDLTKVFANEIAKYSDEWAWIKARISAANYEGLYVGDYIPVTMNAGTVGGASIAQQIFQCQIAGIDTYTGCGDTEIGHHIDFISREVIDSTVTWNPKNNNNGTSVQANPWLASQAYAYLNGVNNYTTSAYNNVAHGGNYSAGGILQLLPTKLTNLIVTKRNLLDSRYDSTKLLTYSTTWAWGDMGKLWLPNEIEVYGTQISSNLGYVQGYWNPEANIAVAYPIYLGSGRNRIKRVSSGGRSNWWLSSADSSNSSYVCGVGSYGAAGGSYAAYAGIRCPLCFRIA